MSFEKGIVYEDDPEQSSEMKPKPPTPTVRVDNTDQSDADEWCDDCHGYTHVSSCRTLRIASKQSLVEKVVNAVYRSMVQYEDGTWLLDQLRAKARVRKLLEAPISQPPASAETCRGNETGFHTCGLPIGGCGKNVVTASASELATGDQSGTRVLQELGGEQDVGAPIAEVEAQRDRILKIVHDTLANLKPCELCTEGKLSVGCSIDKPLIQVDCYACKGSGFVPRDTKQHIEMDIKFPAPVVGEAQVVHKSESSEPVSPSLSGTGDAPERISMYGDVPERIWINPLAPHIPWTTYYYGEGVEYVRAANPVSQDTSGLPSEQDLEDAIISALREAKQSAIEAVELLRATRQILAEYESDDVLQIQAKAIDKFLASLPIGR